MCCRALCFAPSKYVPRKQAPRQAEHQREKEEEELQSHSQASELSLAAAAHHDAAQDILRAGINWNTELEGQELEPLDLLEEFESELE